MDPGRTWFNALVLRQIGVLRLGAGIARDATAAIDGTEPALRSILDRYYDEIEPFGASLASPRAQEILERMRREVRSLRERSFAAALALMAASLTGLWENEAGFLTTLHPSAATEPVRQDVSIESTLPVDGRTVGSWMLGLAATDVERIAQAFTVAAMMGDTRRQAVQRVLGLSSLDGGGGVTETTRNAIEGIARTAAVATSSDARMAFAEANGVRMVRFTAVLDHRTTEICMSLDGKVTTLASARRPPIHFNCRSMLVPVLPGLALPARQSYPDWLAGQSAETQAEILGVTKAKLFRNGGLTIDRFVDYAGRPYSLMELAKFNQSAFRAAGLDPARYAA